MYISACYMWSQWSNDFKVGHGTVSDISFDQRRWWLKCELKDTLKRHRVSTESGIWWKSGNSKCGQRKSGKFINFHGKSRKSQKILERKKGKSVV